MIVTDNNLLDSQRMRGDLEADVLIGATFAANQQGILNGLFKQDEKSIESQPDSDLKKFLINQKPKPVWFNKKRMQRGQRIFKQYALEMMALLGAMSLPYCYAASPGNKALYLSDKMRNSPGKRLMDTASFVISVLTPGMLEDGETGHIHINKVRLIHALSRYYLRKQPTWNMDWGVPINQEDMAGTNLAFSYVILLGMQQSGFILSQKEKEDFLFAWRYIGYQMNIDEALLPSSFLEARQLATTIKIRNFKKTEEGIILTKELLSYYKVSVPPDKADLVPAQIRFYLGNEVAEYIGIISDPFRDKLAATVSTFKSLQSRLSVQPDSYQKMLSQHSLLKKKFTV
jgi:succinate dehydrogenase flavin-adding protein (antitoxin of CptAB toxin-antitoxin module)